MMLLRTESAEGLSSTSNTRNPSRRRGLSSSGAALGSCSNELKHVAIDFLLKGPKWETAVLTQNQTLTNWLSVI